MKYIFSIDQLYLGYVFRAMKVPKWLDSMMLNMIFETNYKFIHVYL
jgi:hypothetical protein